MNIKELNSNELPGFTEELYMAQTLLGHIGKLKRGSLPELNHINEQLMCH